MPSLFFNLPKTPSFIESVKIFPDITHQLYLVIFPSFSQPDGTNAISSISKAELFAQTFANNSTYLGRFRACSSLSSPLWLLHATY